MNIFLLSDSTDYEHHLVLQAEYHCDRHVVKMIAESTQLLVTALESPEWHSVSLELMTEYGMLCPPCKSLSVSQRNHPCAIWARAQLHTIYYLARLAVELCHEHQLRYPLSARHAYFGWLESLVDALESYAESGGKVFKLPEKFPVAISDRPELRSFATPHQEAVTYYRSYYFRTKRHFATWKNRGVPMWFLREQEDWQAKQHIAE